MATASDSSDHADDISECAICVKACSNPRTLPCLHTFCLDCIVSWNAQRHEVSSSSSLACPVCRQQFDVAEDECVDLPNFDISDFVLVKETSSDDDTVHQEEGSDDDASLTEDKTDGGQTKGTEELPLDPGSGDEVAEDAAGEEHLQSQHPLQTSAVDEEVNPGSSGDDVIHVDIIDESLAQPDSSPVIDETVDTPCSQSEPTEDEPLFYHNPLTDKESAPSTTITIITVAENDDYIGNSTVTSSDNNDDVILSPTDECSNVSKQNPDAMFSSPTVAHTVPGDGSVGTLTTLNDRLYLIRRNAKHLEVYDLNTFTLERHLALPGIGEQVYGLVADESTGYLYLSDWDNNAVRRINPASDDDVDARWSVGNQPAGLALTTSGNLLVTCHGASKLQELSTADGSVVREVQLAEEVRLPWHAVQLSDGQFVVSHEGPQHRVCVVGEDGRVVRYYGDDDVDAMQYPRTLVVASEGSILVADQCNNRVLVIDSKMTSGEPLDVIIEGGLQWPHGMCLDESRGRMYIGEWSGGRTIVLDNVKPTQH